MRKLGVCANFINDNYRRRITEAAESWGFAPTFYPDPQAIEPDLGEYEVIFGRPDPEKLKKAKNLRWMCSEFAGVEPYLPDHIWPCPACILSNSSGAYGPTISEHIVMVLLMLLRRMPEYRPIVDDREWTRLEPIRSVTGSHVVLLGCGDIGSNTARRLKALGARVTGVCRSGTSGESAFDAVYPIGELEKVLPTADALIMSLPFTAATERLLSRERIALLPRQCLVINVGRGRTVDQQALVEALENGAIAGAALDVADPEPLPKDHSLWSCPNTIITPHCSGNMALGLTCDLAVELFLRDLKRYAQGLPLLNRVDRALGY